MSNTVIQLKYSNVTNTPPTLNIAEPAYSNVSNILWINDGSGVVAIGGKYYTTIIDASTPTATANTIVLRDSLSNFSANTITANLTGKFTNARTISLSGDANGSISFDGSQNVDIAVDLTASGVTPGNYGSTTKIPTFTVDLDGRISSAANVDVATTFAFQADSGSGSLDLLTDTFITTGGDGITTTAYNGNNTIIIDVDSTVVKTDRASQTINGDIAISGNLIIHGNTLTQDVQTLNITDPIIYLAANNYYSDAVDIGFAGNYFDGSTQRHTGLVRHSTDGKLYAFTNYTPEPNNNIIDITHSSFSKAVLVTDIQSGNVSSLFSAIDVTDGGTGFRTANTGDLIYGTGSNSFGKLLKPSSDSYLKMGSSGTPTWVDTIAVTDGGTGNTTFTVNHVILGNGTNPLTTVGSSTEGHLLTINSSGAPVFQHLNGGSF